MAIIGTNIAAVSAANYYTINSRTSADAIGQLSSGSALANPVDNAAGVAVSGQLSAITGQLNASSQGVQDTISFGQTVDGYLGTVQQGVSQLSVLAQQATNGTLNPTDAQNYATVFNSIQQALTTITNNANFNGTPVFTNGAVTTSVDASGTQASLALSPTGTPASLGIANLNINSPSNALAALQPLSDAIDTIGSRRAQVNADVSALNFFNTNIQTQSVNNQAANARIADANIANESTVNATNNILTQASISVLAQANTTQKSVSRLLLG
jgi:flagellin